jgi:hypothetical protein
MQGKTWLWVALAALALLSVCCIGMLIGGTLAGQNRPAAGATAGAALPTSAQAGGPAEPTMAASAPTSEPVTPTQQPPAPTSAPTQPPPPPPTATSVPTPPPPAAPPPNPPSDSGLQALVDYANAMQPLLEEGQALLERDGKILEASEGGNDAVLCDGRLAADNAAMMDLLQRARAVSPPGDADVIHDLVLRSGDAWTEALNNVELFCNTGNQLYKIPAVVKFWEAAATLQDAGNRFWLLLVAKGIEDWVQR